MGLKSEPKWTSTWKGVNQRKYTRTSRFSMIFEVGGVRFGSENRAIWAMVGALGPGWVQDCSLEGSGRDSGDDLDVQGWIWGLILGPFWEPKGRKIVSKICMIFASIFGHFLEPKCARKEARSQPDW